MCITARCQDIPAKIRAVCLLVSSRTSYVPYRALYTAESYRPCSVGGVFFKRCLQICSPSLNDNILLEMQNF